MRKDFKAYKDLKVSTYRLVISKAKEGEKKTTDITVVSIRECIWQDREKNVWRGPKGKIIDKHINFIENALISCYLTNQWESREDKKFSHFYPCECNQDAWPNKSGKSCTSVWSSATVFLLS